MKHFLWIFAAAITMILGCSDTSSTGPNPASTATTHDHGGGGDWLVDFAKAKAQSAKESKPILMEFTGSDWCPPCMALHDNVLTSDVFKQQIPKKFILLKLDNPQDKSEYKVEGVPTIIVADATGKEQHRQVGYDSSQTPQEWVTKLIAAGNP